MTDNAASDQRPAVPAASAVVAVSVGDRLPDLVVDVTPTFVVSTAIASNDFVPVHHDPEAARRQGSPDIFTNILSASGLVSRHFTDWSGPAAVIEELDLTLRTQNIVGDRLTMRGTVTAVDLPTGRVEVCTVATNRRGTHVEARVVGVLWSAPVTPEGA